MCVSLYKNKYTQYNLLLYNFVLYKQKLLFWMPSTIFFIIVFEGYAHSGCIHLIKNTVNSNIVKYYYNSKNSFLF